MLVMAGRSRSFRILHRGLSLHQGIYPSIQLNCLPVTHGKRPHCCHTQLPPTMGSNPTAPVCALGGAVGGPRPDTVGVRLPTAHMARSYGGLTQSPGRTNPPSTAVPAPSIHTCSVRRSMGWEDDQHYWGTPLWHHFAPPSQPHPRMTDPP